MLTGRSCAVFGFASTRSIAWGIASAWSKAGAQITIGIQSERFRPALIKAVNSWSTPPHIVVCDASDDASIESAVAEAGVVHGGRLSAIAHSLAWAPATAMRAPLLDTNRADFLAAHAVSSYSLIAFARASAPLLAAQPGGGTIITLSYLGAVKAVENYRVMGLAKASLEAAARGLAVELGPKNIRVNVISAGPVDTLAARGIANFNEMRVAVAKRAPLQRDVSIEEVGAVATFLASNAASGITGQTIYVDAGTVNL